MPKLYHLPAAGKRKIFLAVPAYDGVGAGTTWSLAHAKQALDHAGFGFELAILAGGCHVDDARNMLVWKFLQTDCTDLVFLDADLRWDPEDLVKLCTYDRQVVGATYPKKQLTIEYPVKFLDKPELWSEPDGLIEVAGLPAGFLRIRRDAMKEMVKHASPYKIEDDDLAYEVFRRDTHDLTRFSGDYEFCWRWQQLGGHCYLMPEPVMEHGELFVGSWGHQRRTDTYGTFKACLWEIAHEFDSTVTYDDLFDCWGNEYAALSDTLAVLVKLGRERGGPVLEVGSGISTLALAAAGLEVDVLEHDEKWAAKCATVLSAHGLADRIRFFVGPLHDGWYSVLPDRNEYSLAFVDGPPRTKGDRRKFLESGIQADIYVLDDADDPKTMQMANKLGEPAFLGKRPVALISPPQAQEVGPVMIH